MNTQHYPHVFVINLYRDTHKKVKIEAQLKSLKLNYSIIEAVDGKLLSSEQITLVYDKKSALKDTKRELSTGEIGCAMSHINIYKKMLKDNMDIAVILEDDAVLNKDFKTIIKQINQFPKKWELMLLGHRIFNTPDCFIKHSSLGKYTIAKSILRLLATHAYIVNIQGAKKLINATKRLSKPIDCYTGNRRCLDVYAFYPAIIDVDETLVSSIDIDGGREKLFKIQNNKTKTKTKIVTSRLLKCLIKKLAYRIGL